MFLASFLIGLREGLEASLVIGILIAFLRKRQASHQVPRLWTGIAVAIVLALALGAVFTFGSSQLSFEMQETIGGTMSILAVVMITAMVFWMAKMGRTFKASLESNAASALASGAGWSMFWLGLITVGREGIETTLMLWGWAMQPVALLGALAGIMVAVALGFVASKGMVRINYASFFRVTGVLLVVVAAGVLAYGIHDLQEARVLPGPFSGAPITPTDFRTGEVLVGFFTDRPFWGAPFPFGWAFDLQDSIDPAGFWAAFLQGTIGFTPLMSWLQVVAWFAYIGITLPLFLRHTRRAPVTTRETANVTIKTTTQPTLSTAQPVAARAALHTSTQ